MRFDFIVRASPLSTGFGLSSQGYLAAGDSVATLTATVTSEETWRSTARGSTLRVWVVQMNFAGLESTLWIEKLSRALVRQTIRLTPAVTMMFMRPGMVRVGG